MLAAAIYLNYCYIGLGSIPEQLLNALTELWPFLQVAQSILHKRLHIAHFLPQS